MKLKEKFKELLWKIGLYPVTKCPYCQSKTMAHGFADADWGKTYDCTNVACSFGKSA